MYVSRRSPTSTGPGQDGLSRPPLDPALTGPSPPLRAHTPASIRPRSTLAESRVGSSRHRKLKRSNPACVGRAWRSEPRIPNKKRHGEPRDIAPPARLGAARALACNTFVKCREIHARAWLHAPSRRVIWCSWPRSPREAGRIKRRTQREYDATCPYMVSCARAHKSYTCTCAYRHS